MQIKKRNSDVFNPNNLIGILGLLFLIAGCISCSEQNQYIEPPPPEVTFALPVQKKVTEYLQFTGTTKAVSFVEVRARVSGELKSMHFEPGTHVEKGDLLFIIDPEPYQADLDAAIADLASAKAEYERTETELKRADQLIKKNFISKTDHLRRKTERDVAKANIGKMASAVTNARIKLGYTRVTSPISGRVSRKYVDMGNLVGESEATLLTTVTAFRPMYAYFHLNERDLLRVMQVHRDELSEKGLDPDATPDSELDIPVYLNLANETGYPHKGIMDFGESAVDTETGTVELRAVFQNEHKPPLLLPGLFASLRFPVGMDPNALLVDERAFASDQSGEYLLLVNDKNKVEKRLVDSGQVVDGMKVVKKGIKMGDKIIVNGLQKARPGAEVNPQPESKTTSKPAQG